MTDFSLKVRDLFDQQLSEWPLARDNYYLLENVRVRSVPFGDFDIDIQYNPGRLTSSAARVDTRSVEARPCFLCEKNRPSEQIGIPFSEEYIILVNPFPIFRRHLTIVSVRHSPQRIKVNFGAMLRLSEALPEYVLFYNGPECGASAPDHQHFQAGNRGFLPLEKEYSNQVLREKVAVAGTTELWLWRGYDRGLMTLRGTDNGALETAFKNFYDRFSDTQPGRPEPMLNILSCYYEGVWTIHIIPRRIHRPECYFRDGDERILLSPASVDIGGVFITPREEDFNKITANDIKAILEEVCLNEDEMSALTKGIL